MTTRQSSNQQRLVMVHRAANELEADLLVQFLADNAVTASLSDPPTRADAALHAGYCHPDTQCPVFVLEAQADQARQLIHEFLSAQGTDQGLEQAAAAAPHPSKEQIHELREAVKEERRTFDFLGWAGVAFLAAATILWMIWPAWLKVAVPPTPLRWLMVVLLALATVFIGSWTGRQTK